MPFAFVKYLTHLTELYPLFSNTFRKRTIKPEDVNINTWKSTEIGGLDHAFCSVVLVRVASAVKVISDPPCMRGILRRPNSSKGVGYVSIVCFDIRLTQGK